GWIDELADERRLLQGLIQVAAGFYKLQVGSPQGTVKLLEQALKKLRDFVDNSLGVDLDQFIPEVEYWLEQSRNLVAAGRADYQPELMPQISYRRDDQLSEERSLDCPYCGENVTVNVEPSLESQEYVEDCPVCCRPWTVLVAPDPSGSPSVTLRRADE